MPAPRAKPDHSPMVGIGMPVFNGERFIAEAIESFLAQTFKDFQLVIVDNHSTDATSEICQSFASRDPRVRYIKQRQNYGLNFNFNSAFRLTSGKYFKWAAYDDVCAPEFLGRCVESWILIPPLLWPIRRCRGSARLEIVWSRDGEPSIP